MKKFIALILSVLMMISLVACGNSDTSEPTSGGNEQVESSETDGENDNSLDSSAITLDDLMKAPESSESDFECVDHGNGDVELQGYLGSSDIVVIPETWEDKKITSIGTFAFSEDSPVKAIRLSDSITNLKMSSFVLNRSLEIVVCGSGLTTIGETVFQECSNLRTVVLNDGLVTIGGGAFGFCTSLSELEIPESVTDIQPTPFYDNAEDFKIIGKAGSAAEQYAASVDIPFEAK